MSMTGQHSVLDVDVVMLGRTAMHGTCQTPSLLESLKQQMHMQGSLTLVGQFSKMVQVSRWAMRSAFLASREPRASMAPSGEKPRLCTAVVRFRKECLGDGASAGRAMPPLPGLRHDRPSCELRLCCAKVPEELGLMSDWRQGHERFAQKG